MNCKNCCVIACDGYGQDYEPERCEFYTRMSHGDRIRSMQDAELAEFIIGVLCYTKSPYMELREKALRGNELHEWLEEIEDDNGND